MYPFAKASVWTFVVASTAAFCNQVAVQGATLNTEGNSAVVSRESVTQFSWITDYGLAMKDAKAGRKMLVVAFVPPHSGNATTSDVDATFSAKGVSEHLRNVAAVKLTTDAVVSIDGKQQKLIDHFAFAELRRRPGLAMIDLRNPNSEVYGQVVSVFPFNSSRRFDEKQLRVLLTLPTGTLTQRTLVFAVRTHTERPQSALSSWHPELAAETESHSQHQAQIGVQGHHQWDMRFHRVNSKMPGGLTSTEVCAESWPNQGLFDAAIECVDSWRQSSGHWHAVSRRHAFFGYDMKRGRNGIWYATGIFAGR